MPLAIGHIARIDLLFSQLKFTRTFDRSLLFKQFLKKQIPKLSNEQIMYEMQHLLVLLKQAHNNLFLPGNIV